MLIAQITDTHIKTNRKKAYGIVDTAAYLERCVEAVNALDPHPDCVLLTGDLVDFGTPGEYEILQGLLSPLKMPLYAIPGNHDDRRNLCAAFPNLRPDPSADGFVQYAIEEWPVRLVGIDTIIPERGDGLLCEQRLAWIDRTLAQQPDKPTLIFMHHPPFVTGIAHMDALGLANADKFRAIVGKHKQVERVVAGHVHRSIQVRFAGTVASVAPSCAHQVALDLRPNGPSAFRLEPPGYHLHYWNGNNLITHTAAIGDYPGPYPFFMADGTLID